MYSNVQVIGSQVFELLEWPAGFLYDSLPLTVVNVQKETTYNLEEERSHVYKNKEAGSNSDRSRRLLMR